MGRACWNEVSVQWRFLACNFLVKQNFCVWVETIISKREKVQEMVQDSLTHSDVIHGVR